jgi:hypothetical protein
MTPSPRRRTTAAAPPHAVRGDERLQKALRALERAADLPADPVVRSDLESARLHVLEAIDLARRPGARHAR